MHEVTELLDEWNADEPAALAKLMPLVFDDVREIAQNALSHEAPGHTLQPTALVNEVYLRLVGRRSVRFKNRAQFFGFLADLVRRILVDHARRKLSAKRGTMGRKIPFDDSLRFTLVPDPAIVAVDDALRDLAAFDRRKSRIVELRFFIGLTQPEIAEVLGISLKTVNREWLAAKLWLRRELRGR